MADIFLSYAREDLAKAKLLAEALEQQGWSVFWDRSSILAGQDFEEVIEQAIEQARCMIVAWSEASIKSDWVRGEADTGREQKKLVPITFNSIKPPIAFRALHTEDFSDWNGNLDSEEFQKLLRALTLMLGGPSQAPRINASTSRETIPRGTMFFISYSRTTDLPWAEALYKAIIALGVADSEVWFDRSSIEPGQDFRRRNIEGISTCRYFLPLLSDKAMQHEDAYMFNEWQEANIRNSRMNREFILPVIVDKDYSPERYKAKPINIGGWARLDYCHAPEGEPDRRMRSKLGELIFAAMSERRHEGENQ